LVLPLVWLVRHFDPGVTREHDDTHTFYLVFQLATKPS